MAPLDNFTIGYLILDDSLGYHYYRLFNVRWFPFLRIKKFTLTWKEIILEDLPNFHFMVFDIYEIHIQAFLYFINGNYHLSILISTTLFWEIYIQNVYIKIVSKKQIWSRLSELLEHTILTFAKIINFQAVPIFILDFVKVSWPLQR